MKNYESNQKLTDEIIMRQYLLCVLFSKVYEPDGSAGRIPNKQFANRSLVDGKILTVKNSTPGDYSKLFGHSLLRQPEAYARFIIYFKIRSEHLNK